jgi:DNA-binding GntR family transcriptional regulator
VLDDDAAVTSRTLTRRRRMALKDEAAAFLRDAILSGELRAGSKVDQDETAERLGTSRLPVREAIITLAVEGLIDHVPHRGAFVANISETDVLDHYVCFGLLSAYAARRAVGNLTDDDLAELDALASRIDGGIVPAEQERDNLHFHELINRAGGSRRLIANLKMMGNSLPTRFFEFQQQWPESSQIPHSGILVALHARDPDAAAAAIAEHFQAAGEQTVKGLRAAGYWSDDN